ncbi:MAG: hypothetical protein ABSG95_15075 [Solirubrobacteraceae bacterium]
MLVERWFSKLHDVFGQAVNREGDDAILCDGGHKSRKFGPLDEEQALPAGAVRIEEQPFKSVLGFVGNRHELK